MATDSSEDGDTLPQEGGNVAALQQKARWLLKRCKYEDAAGMFKEVLKQLQQGQEISSEIKVKRGLESIQLFKESEGDSLATRRREIIALEGLAVCLSRLLNDSGAEAAQRQALELRCRAWKEDDGIGHNLEGYGKDQPLNVTTKSQKKKSVREMAAAKRAALPCLRNLASFVSNQGRHVDAEVVLRTVLKTLEESTNQHADEAAAADDAGSAEWTTRTTTRKARLGDNDDGAKQPAVSESNPTDDVPPAASYHAEAEHPGMVKGSGVGRRPEKNNTAEMRRLDDDKGCDEGMRSNMVGAEEEPEEDAEQTTAVTKHHLAVVLHAQGRTREAQDLLESSVATLKKTNTPHRAVWIAQAMHDLAGVVRPADPARACSLYRESLRLMEATRGEGHFLTAPTLNKLGSLLGDSLTGVPPAPAAPAGPGAAGVARAAGLAEAVCAPGDAASAAVDCELDASEEAESMIKRAVAIQDTHLGPRHPAVATSMRSMAEFYRKQGRLSEAEPLFRRAIGIWENSPGPMDTDAVGALHGLAHCVLAGAGADWLGRFEEAFALVDQAYRIASAQTGSDPDGSYSSSRLLLEALRMIRSRQRQGRGDPQPASAAIMDAVWNGKWDPANGDRTEQQRRDRGTSPLDRAAAASRESGSMSENSHKRRGSEGDDSRCAVCLEEVWSGCGSTVASNATTSKSMTSSTPDNNNNNDKELHDAAVDSGGSVVNDEKMTGHSRRHFLSTINGIAEIDVDIGLDEAALGEQDDTRARGRLAYLPCGHHFHTHCIGRWLVHSSSCPSCRSKVEDDAPAPPQSPRFTTTRSVACLTGSPTSPSSDSSGSEPSPLSAGRQGISVQRSSLSSRMRDQATQSSRIRATHAEAGSQTESTGSYSPLQPAHGPSTGGAGGGRGFGSGRAPFC